MDEDHSSKTGGEAQSGDPPPMVPGALARLETLMPVLEARSFRAGEWQAPPGQMPYYRRSESVRRLVRWLSENQVTYAFDWPAWQDEGKRYVENSELLLGADLETCRRLLTMHIRVDRFVQGHLGTMIESGHILAILRRLLTIQGEKP